MRWIASAAMGLFLMLVPYGTASAQECNELTAVRTTIAEITADGEEAVGRCVSIVGIVRWSRIYADNAARYRQPRIFSNPSSTGAILGLYNVRAGDRPRRMRLVGRVSSCDRAHEVIEEMRRSSGDIIMASGYCHTSYGLNLYVEAQHTLGPARFVRIPSGTASSDLGNLAPMEAGEAHDRLLVAANALFDSVSDPARAREILRNANGARHSDGDADRMIARLRPDDQASANTRTVTRMFGWRIPSWADERERAEIMADAARRIEGYACRSSHPDAEQLWPISEQDAMLVDARPYRCVRLTIERDGSARYYHDVDEDDDALIAEPRH